MIFSLVFKVISKKSPSLIFFSLLFGFHCFFLFCKEIFAFVIVTVVSKLVTDRHFFWGELISNCRYRIALPEELIAITETDVLDFQHKISHYRYRFSLEFHLISITDTDFGLETN